MVKRSYGDGKAVKYIREKLGIDLTDGKTESLSNVIKKVRADFKNISRYFLWEGYYKYLLLLPIVQLLTYGSYLKGFKEKV